jgi:oxygen-independent coproporphyrinogen-3 oxidase
MRNLVKSLYIHYPYCRHLCNYCDFYKRKQTKDTREHQEKLFQTHLTSSLKILKEKVHEEYAMKFAPLETLYIGGGTPSLLGEVGAMWLRDFLQENSLPFDSLGHEFTLEIDPGTVELSDLRAWRSTGVNRFSFGLQTLDERLIEICDRKSKLADALNTLELINEQNVNFSVDFLLGIPQSENRNIIQELTRILKFSPTHISLYILNPKTNYPLKNFMPEDEQVAAEYQLVHDFLTTSGFRHYEVSNYALPGFEGRHNYGYWFRKSIAALGPSAAGHYQYKDDHGENQFLRYTWNASLVEHTFELEKLTKDQVLLEDFYLRFRVAEPFGTLDFPHLAQKECEKLGNLFNEWTNQSYLQEVSAKPQQKFIFLPKGWIILDSLMKELFGKISF